MASFFPSLTSKIKISLELVYATLLLPKGCAKISLIKNKLSPDKAKRFTSLTF